MVKCQTYAANGLSSFQGRASVPAAAFLSTYSWNKGLSSSVTGMVTHWMTKGCMYPFQQWSAVTMAMPCNIASCIAVLFQRCHGISRATILTGPSFLTSFENSCASYLAAGNVAFSVGLHLYMRKSCFRQLACSTTTQMPEHGVW